MFEFSQSTGEMTQNGGAMVDGSKCYSGTGDGRNNPDMEDTPDVGPIPQGKYRIGPAFDGEHMGPMVMRLVPLPGTDMLGRSGFFVHGNDKKNDASHGCIVAPPLVRAAIARSQDRILVVTE